MHIRRATLIVATALFDQVAGQLATKTTAMWLDTWDKDNWFAEYYDPERGLPNPPVRCS